MTARKNPYAIKMPPLDKVKEDQAAGMTPKQMAETYGVAPATVKNFIRRHKIAQKTYVRYPPDEEIIAALERRESAHRMSIRFGIHKDTLWRRILDRRLRERAKIPALDKSQPRGLQPDQTKIVIETQDGHKISLPRIPTIDGNYEARP